MFDATSYLWGLIAILIAAVATWIVSIVKRDVSIVDGLWAAMFLIAAVTYTYTVEDAEPRAVIVLVMVALWAVRLSGYITWRNWGEEEDFRYQRIRANNQPGFAFKSLYIVFGLQGVIGWLVSVPLLAAIVSPAAFTGLDYIGIGVWLVGMVFETLGDYQLARFKRDPANRRKVLDGGLWRYTRHPNYFGEAVLWWGFYLMAASAGAWWTIFAPLLMTYLLVRVSGVALLEKDIAQRRPAYREYIRQTNAFLPWRPRPATGNGAQPGE